MSEPERITAALLQEMPLPWPEEGSKENRGRALIVGGSVEVPGSVYLAGLGALRAGAGKLQVATCESRAPHLSAALPEARVIALAESAAGGVCAQAARVVQPCARRCHALLLGPGMVDDPELPSFVRDVLAEPLPALVLDAGALDCAHDIANIEALRGRLVLTPHAGEMARLLDVDSEDIVDEPLRAARQAAARLQAVVVMKGARTEVVSPDGLAWRFDGGSVGLATSGSGDVLAGILAGLLARGASPLQASLWAVYLHGEAGARLARTVGPLGFLARELLPEVPRILARFSPAATA